MKNINKALGDNAKFYPNYLANHVASDFKFHLDNGIGRMADEIVSMQNEISFLSETKAQLVRVGHDTNKELRREVDLQSVEIAELREMLSECRGALSACSIQESRNDGTENRMKIKAIDNLVGSVDLTLAKHK